MPVSDREWRRFRKAKEVLLDLRHRLASRSIFETPQTLIKGRFHYRSTTLAYQRLLPRVYVLTPVQMQVML